MMVLLHPTISVLVAVSIIALQLLRLSYVVLPLSTSIEVNEERKAAAPILITLLGIVIEVSEQPEKA